MKKAVVIPILCFILLGIAGCSGESGNSGNSTSSKPNIILVFADDLGYADLGCQGSSDIRTPHIDGLASDGVRFTAGYVTAPQCGPSRAGLISGLNQARFGYLDNKNNQGLPSSEKVPTIAEYLKVQGYSTGIIGKWHIGDEPEYSQEIVEASRPWNKGFDYSLMIHRGMSHYFPYRVDGMTWMTSRDREPKLTEVMEGSREITLKDFPEEFYLTDIISHESVNFIHRHKDEPFFLYVAYNAPHTPLVAREKDMAVNGHITDPSRLKFAGMMTALDRGVGEIRTALEQTGLDQRTLIFFISDNGGPTSKNTSRNDPLSGFKGDVLEGGIRVPFIACWPGVIPGGNVLDEPVSTLDIIPTAVELAGGKLNPELDYMGVDLVPYMTGNSSHLPREYLVWRWRNKMALRQGELKVVQPFEELPHSGLYNLSENIRETPETKLTNEEMQHDLEKRLRSWNESNVNSIQTAE